MGESLVVVGAVRAEVVVHRVVVRVEHRSERVGAVRLPVRASVGADVPVLRLAFAEMLLVLKPAEALHPWTSRSEPGGIEASTQDFQPDFSFVGVPYWAQQLPVPESAMFATVASGYCSRTMAMQCHGEGA